MMMKGAADNINVGGAGSARTEVVECSMCGDAGLPDKLFLCRTRGCHRHQHTYCSNWYPEDSSTNAGMCNWCTAAGSTHQGSDKGNMLHCSTARRVATGLNAAAAVKSRTMNSAPVKIVVSHNDVGNNDKVKPKAAGCKPTSATRTATGRRYKLVSEM